MIGKKYKCKLKFLENQDQLISEKGYLGIEQYGEPLPFEKPPIGRTAVLEDEDSYFFDYEDMQEYCLHFNIDILIDLSVKDGSWEVIKIQKDPSRFSRKLSFINKILLRDKKKRNWR